MLKATKKNRVVRIADEKLAEYKKLGYTVTDMAGNVVYEPENAEKKVKALEAENAELKAEIEALKAAAASGKKTTAKTKSAE